MRLNRIESYTSNGITMFRWRIPDGRSVPAVIRSLRGRGLRRRDRTILYKLLQQQSSADGAAAATPA